MTTVSRKNIVKLFEDKRGEVCSTVLLGMRLTPQEKQSIREAAQSLNVTMTEYLLKLHRYAVSGKLKATAG
jgi:hypothetical protein